MVAADMTLQHASVNGGTPVELNGSNLSWEWNNNCSANPAEGHYDIVEPDTVGFENPVLKISGTFKASDTTTANRMNQVLLMDFLQVCNDIKLVVAMGPNGEAKLKGRPLDGYSVGGEYTDYLNIQIINASFHFGVPESEEGDMITYEISAREARPSN